MEDSKDQPREWNPRLVFVPREIKTPSGTTVFRTMDGEVYARLEDGSIRSTQHKLRGKAARRADKRARRK